MKKSGAIFKSILILLYRKSEYYQYNKYNKKLIYRAWSWIIRPISIHVKNYRKFNQKKIIYVDATVSSAYIENINLKHIRLFPLSRPRDHIADKDGLMLSAGIPQYTNRLLAIESYINKLRKNKKYRYGILMQNPNIFPDKSFEDMSYIIDKLRKVAVTEITKYGPIVGVVDKLYSVIIFQLRP